MHIGTLPCVLQEALQNMDDSALTVDQLDALSRAVPDDTARKDIRLYLKVAILPQLCPLLLEPAGPALQHSVMLVQMLSACAGASRTYPPAFCHAGRNAVCYTC